MGNTAYGTNALAGVTIGYSNSAFGDSALQSNASGCNNTAVGDHALQLNSTGHSNVGVGASALLNNTDGGANTAVGVAAMHANTTGGDNTALGVSALAENVDGGGNTAIGVQAQLHRVSGNHNNGFGSSSLFSNTSGSGNVGVGSSAGYTSTTGNNNVFVGYNTGRGITTGSGNTILGAQVMDLPADLENNIILSDGNGNIKAVFDGSAWYLTGNVFLVPGNKLYFGNRGAIFSGAERVAVSSATVIYSVSGASVGPQGAEVIVSGYDTADTTKSFTDKVLYTANGTYQVIGSTGANSPAGRSYAVSGGSLTLAMGASTYSVSTSGLNQTN